MTVNVFMDGLDSKVVPQQSFIDAEVLNLTRRQRARKGAGETKG